MHLVYKNNVTYDIKFDPVTNTLSKVHIVWFVSPIKKYIHNHSTRLLKRNKEKKNL